MGSDIHGLLQKRWSPGRAYETISEIEHGRNYILFAALAGVRNYYNIKPISEPRGIPDDISYDPDKTYDEEGKRLPGALDLGDHSFSWLTLRELLDWDGWDQTFTLSGYVARTEYERMMAAGETAPNNWCGGVGGGGTVKTSATEVIAGTAPSDWNYVYCEWQGVVRDYCETFMKWLDYLKSAHDWMLYPSPHNPDYVPDTAALRIVFGFDS